MTARVIATAVLVCTALLLGGCQRDDGSGPTKITGRLFVFNYRVSTAVYMVTLGKLAPLPEDSAVITEFENPQGGAPIVTRTKIYPFWDKITLESPALHCIVKDKPYTVKIRIVGPGDTPLQHLQTTITSDLDQSILPAKPLVVGPVYTPNPEVFKADGSTDYAPETGCKT